VGCMGFAFAETMSGWLQTKDGQRRSFHFRVEAVAPSTWRHLKDGVAHLRGVVHAPPFTEAAETSGTILIRPFGIRVIRYRMTFHSDDGRLLTFAGQKNLRWLALRRTFTELEGEIFDSQGVSLAISKTHFDLRRDWLPFARSFHRAG
jgi:putative SOS response-associated peptidase YedK